VDNEINLDLDLDRIKSVLLETYNVCKNQLDIEFNISSEEFVSKINPYLNSNRISIPISLPLPSKHYPEMVIEVNLRQKSVFARFRNRKKQAQLNYYLNAL
jgi:hypothetical protein